MGLLDLFGNSKGKKKKARRCDITGTMLEYGEGRLLTTSQVVISQKFWDSIMTEPEAMAYTIGHFKNNDRNATRMREFIFDKYAEKSDPWIVSEDCLNTFGISADSADLYANEWWETGGEFRPPECGMAKDVLEPVAFERAKSYAIEEAGATRV